MASSMARFERFSRHTYNVKLILNLYFFSKFMRSECLNSKYAYDTPLPIARLVGAISDSILMYTVPYLYHISAYCAILCQYHTTSYFTITHLTQSYSVPYHNQHTIHIKANTLYHTRADYTKPYHTIPYPIIPDQTIPYHIVPYHTRADHTTPYPIILYHTTPYHIVPCHTRADHTTPYHIVPYQS